MLTNKKLVLYLKEIELSGIELRNRISNRSVFKQLTVALLLNIGIDY